MNNFIKPENKYTGKLEWTPRKLSRKILKDPELLEQLLRENYIPDRDIRKRLYEKDPRFITMVTARDDLHGIDIELLQQLINKDAKYFDYIWNHEVRERLIGSALTKKFTNSTTVKPKPLSLNPVNPTTEKMATYKGCTEFFKDFRDKKELVHPVEYYRGTHMRLRWPSGLVPGDVPIRGGDYVELISKIQYPLVNLLRSGEYISPNDLKNAASHFPELIIHPNCVDRFNTETFYHVLRRFPHLGHFLADCYLEKFIAVCNEIRKFDASFIQDSPFCGRIAHQKMVKVSTVIL